MNSRGNAFVYILIAVVMFAALSYALVKSNEGGGAIEEIDQGRAEIAANAILAYAASAQGALSRMEQMGTSAADVDFVLPSDAAFNTPPNLNKLFHPDGGGLSYKPLPADAAATQALDPEEGFYIGRFNNIEWTPTTAQDVVFTAYSINEKTCAAINKKLTGSDAIQTSDSSTLMQTRLVSAAHHGHGNADFAATECPPCDEQAALCISNGFLTPTYIFYSILEAR